MNFSDEFRATTKFYFNKNSYTGDLDFYISNRTPDGKLAFAKPVELEFEVKEEGAPKEPVITIPAESAESTLQEMIQDLASRGIQTDQAALVEGELKATKSHLSDMRQLLKLK